MSLELALGMHAIVCPRMCVCVIEFQDTQGHIETVSKKKKKLEKGQ